MKLDQTRATSLLLVVNAVLLTVQVAGLLPGVRAQAGPAKKCVWTYISEGGLNIGKNGELRLGENWKRLSQEGWELKAVDGIAHYFERCE